ncbi:MAG: hypothetical protein OH338_04970 [Candidatus Parvarchaeota archaeon]|nr:hypothetical protein [Candidatus Parvarchaeum tengchongense]
MKQVFKVDVDLVVPESWLKLWIETRKAILKELGIEPVEINIHKTERGFHAWVHGKVKKKLTPTECNFVQWVLGDDTGRVRINQRRIACGMSWRTFNKLFSEVIWRKKHKCNCDIHKKILKRMEEGRVALLKIMEKEKIKGISLPNIEKNRRLLCR